MANEWVMIQTIFPAPMSHLIAQAFFFGGGGGELFCLFVFEFYPLPQVKMCRWEGYVGIILMCKEKPGPREALVCSDIKIAKQLNWINIKVS